MIDNLSDFFTHGWMYTVLMCIYAATVLSVVAVILSENRNPVKSLAWVTILLLLPLVGLALYLFFGRSIKNTRMISRRNRRRLRRRERLCHSDPRKLGLSHASLSQINLARSLTGAQFYVGNSIETFVDGASKFDSFMADLRSARRSINMQYYIFEDDRLGSSVADILIAKAAEGVTVRVIYDHVGSCRVSNNFFRRLKAAGIATHPFFKVTFPQFGTRINWRNHRKICVIDGSIGYIGGMNVADRYVDGGRFPRWRDTHLRIEGPVVAALLYSFVVDWQFMGEGLIEDCVAEPAVLSQRPGAISGVGAQLLTSGPMSQWSNVAFAFHKAIAMAKRRVFIQTPYFLPTEGLLKALQTAALSHVDVRIMMPRRSDSAMLTRASASYVAECLRAGIKIYLYDAGMLHAKTIIIDDEMVSVGSTNFDFRSFEYNFEANIFLYSEEFAASQIEIFRNDIRDCTRVTPSQWRRRPLKFKVAESVVRLLSPIL